jgi:hypothetical protein
MIRLNQLAANFVRVNTKTATLYFSHETLIAFECGIYLYISENRWSSTTGKHLNLINKDKKIRLNYEDFNKKYEDLIGDIL